MQTMVNKIKNSPRSMVSIMALLVALTVGSAFSFAQSTGNFQVWAQQFKSRAMARGIPENLYLGIMQTIKPDLEVLKMNQTQPEAREEIWQYLNRRVSDWRIREGRAKLQQYSTLLGALEKTYGVDPAILVSIWGMESSYGGIIDNPKYMRPVLASLSTLAWQELRRRRYWEQELLNALVIVARGWATPDEMVGSWAGAMGHTQWMPEVWLNVGVDFNKDGKISPFGLPDDALAGSARFLINRGNYVSGLPWGFEVRADKSFNMQLADNRTARSMGEWESRGLMNADGTSFKNKNLKARVIFPAGAQGPGFALTQNFRAMMAYNPSFKYALAVCVLADRIRGSAGFMASWQGAEGQLSLEETIELQKRLTAIGFDTGGDDGRVGSDTTKAVKAYQLERGLKPDGYAGPHVLQALRKEDKSE